MPGTFSKASRPVRPGAYVNFVVQERAQAPAPLDGIVAVSFTHDWGPSEIATQVSSLQEFQATFGSSADTPGYAAVKQAFQGEGVNGRGGAAQVVAFRMVGAAGAKATRTIQNTTPAGALKLDAVYDGSRGNDLKVQVIANAGAPTTHLDLIIFDDTVELERYTFAKADVASAVALINAGSSWVVATQLITGVALAVDANPVAMASGNDGTTLLGADYTAAMAGIEAFRFSVCAWPDLTDETIFASIDTWQSTHNSRGKRFLTLVGGAAGESAATATGATVGSGKFNDENVVRVGVGTYTDADLGDLSTSQLTPRIAGVIAARGTRTATFARLAGLEVKVGATEADILSALAGGVTVLARDSNATAPVRLERSITTYTSDTAQKPKSVYGNVKFVRAMGAFEMAVTEFAEENVIGQLPVNDSTREYLVGQAKRIASEFESENAFQPGTTVGIDQDPPPSDDDEFIGLVYGVKLGRDAEQLYNTVYIG